VSEQSEETRLTEAQLKEALSNELVGSWLWNIQKNKVVTDERIAQAFNVSPTKALKGLPLSTFLKAIYLDDRQRVEKEIQSSLKRGKKLRIECRIGGPGKTHRWVVARGSIERDKASLPITAKGVIIDITDRKEIEMALSESESRLRFMADTVPQLLWTSDTEGNIDYYNKRWKDFTGLSLGNVERDRRSKLLHPDEREKVEKTWNHSIKTGKPYEMEYRLYHADSDSYLWVIGRAVPYRNKAGKIIKWYGTATEIDEQKRSANIQRYLANVSKELASSMDYETTLRKISQLCIPEVADWCSVELLNDDNEIEQVSVAHIDPKKVSLAKEYREYNPPTIDQPTGVPAVIRTGKSEFYPVISEELIRTSIADKKVRDFMLGLHIRSIIIAPIKAQDKPIGAITFVSSESGRYYTQADLTMAEDVASRISLSLTNVRLFNESMQELTRRRQLEKELLLEKQRLESRVKERTEQLQATNAGLREEIIKRQKIEKERIDDLIELNRSKDEFISLASHQLRTPATGVKQYVGMVLEGFMGKIEPAKRTILEKAYESNERQLRIVNDLLKVAQVDAGKVMLKKSNVDLKQLLEDVIREQASNYKEKSQTITLTNKVDDATVVVDPSSIRMVVENIIDNASKYSEEHSKTTVTVREKADAICIDVADQGVGVSETENSKLFEKFSRLDNPLSTKVGGTGLGLYWAKKIMTLHDGTITYRANRKKGTVFTICLPKPVKV